MTRIFLTTSHFSTFLMSVYARETQDAQTKDILVLDRSGRKPAAIKQFHQAAHLHTWSSVHDFSIPLPDDHNYAQGVLKKLTQKFKSKPVIRSIYNFLFSLQRKKTLRDQHKLLRGRFPGQDQKTELFVLKEAVLSEAFQLLFPNAAVNYFEHGLSDYSLLLRQPPSKGNFYCVFANPFRDYLNRNGKLFSFVQPFLDPAVFAAVCSSYFEAEPGLDEYMKIISDKKKQHALLIMQPMEMYHVDNNLFWRNFLDKCIAAFPEPSQITFIVKPHPFQSPDSIQVAADYFREHDLKWIMLSGHVSYGSIEISFALWCKNVSYVFSPFSSAIFYLSQLYPATNCKYYYDINFTGNHLRQAPADLVKSWKEIQPLITEVFAEKCVPL